ncbi:DUF992 domain-containing protein [Chelatococcus sp. GCM10030263]|uniref:DUF992 domain-containing protein n=1 Tax=Chelatococcus sp. GCM10030263 TaxID=3273387 RepID=UPI003618C679
MNNRILPRLLGAATLGVVVVATSLPAAAQRGENRVGRLTCNVSGGPGLLITSAKALSCVYHDRAGWQDHYVGTIRRFGLDLGATTGGTLVWDVLSTSRSARRGALAGGYGGVSGEATAGAGVGANLLVGGSRRSFSLQPLSVQGQRGVNIALGVAALELAPARVTGRRR